MCSPTTNSKQVCEGLMVLSCGQKRRWTRNRDLTARPFKVSVPTYSSRRSSTHLLLANTASITRYTLSALIAVVGRPRVTAISKESIDGDDFMWSGRRIGRHLIDRRPMMVNQIHPSSVDNTFANGRVNSTLSLNFHFSVCIKIYSNTLTQADRQTVRRMPVLWW